MRRDQPGRFKEADDVGRSLAPGSAPEGKNEDEAGQGYNAESIERYRVCR